MNKNFKKYLLVVGIILVIYNLLVFIIPFKHINNLTFWLTWVFGLISILGQPIIAFIALKDSQSLKSKIYGWPIIKIGYVYLIVQLIICLLFFILGIFVNVATWIVVLLSIVLIGLISIGLIATDTYKEEIIKMEESAPLSTKFINNLKANSRSLLTKVDNSKLKAELQVLIDTINYSDPVSSDSSLEIEDEINRKFNDLKNDISNYNFDNVIDNIRELTSLVNERNEIVKINKK